MRSREVGDILSLEVLDKFPVVAKMEEKPGHMHRLSSARPRDAHHNDIDLAGSLTYVNEGHRRSPQVATQAKRGWNRRATPSTVIITYSTAVDVPCETDDANPAI